jgi:glycosyltransferase involved in cell wall biosynthesis
MGALLAGEPIPAVAEALRGQGVTWWSLPDWKVGDKERRWQFIKGFRRVNALEPWDVVAFEHCSPLSVIGACTWSRIRDGRRFARVWHQHQGIPSPRGVKKYVSTMRLLAPFMNAYAAVSDLGAKSFRERGCPEEKIQVIYYGVQLPGNLRRGWFRPKLGLEASDRLMVTAASLIPRKGLDVLLQALPPLFKEFPQWHLVIAGGGPLLDELQALCRQLQIQSRVHFLGIVNNVPEIVADCNLFVLASRNEAAPVAILEAMACGLPVVATDVGYIRDVIVHGRSGLLVPSEDVAALYSALRSVLLDEKVAQDFGAQARDRVEHSFSLNRQVEGYLNLYRQVLAGG